ncbi:MAG: NAD(+) synthase [Bacteroidales bacterium]|jgi:NAD+ synthase (glutamine-hydrolysing)|nr:NAD(+) synthase [Bacteroidales bacterium]
MRVQLNQINPKTLSFEDNQRIILSCLNKTNDDTLSIFPELSISGSPLFSRISYNDVFSFSSFVLDSLIKEKRDVIIGSALKIEDKKYNSLVFLSKGEVIGFSNKKRLSIFDEGFSIGNGIETINYKNETIAFGFMEDIEEFLDTKPKITTLILCSNTLFTLNKQKEVLENISIIARKLNANIVFCNRFGAEGGYIFNGASCIVNQKGEICALFDSFKQESEVFQIENIKKINQNALSHYKKILEGLSLSIRDYFDKNNIGKAVVGLSGGVDSALVAALAVRALGKERVIGVLMPSQYSSSHSISDALLSVKNLGIEHYIVPIEEMFFSCSNTYNSILKDNEFSLAEENLQSRLRCVTLMFFANKMKAALLNTTNKSEASVGYGTLYGDTSGAISVLADLYKTDVWLLSKFINEEYRKTANSSIDSLPIPANSIEKAPSAELRYDQKDTDSLPPYDILDKILMNYIDRSKNIEEICKEFDVEGIKVEKTIINRVIELVKINEWKRRQCPMAVKLSNSAFGIDKKFPIS